MGVEQHITYSGELRCELVHGPSGATLTTDAPTDNKGRGAAFSPTDLLGSALAACAITTMAIKAPDRGIEFGSASGRIVKDMTRSSPRRVQRLTVDIQMPADLTPDARDQLETIARRCPVALSLAPEIEIAMSFTYPD